MHIYMLYFAMSLQNISQNLKKNVQISSEKSALVTLDYVIAL